MSTALIIIDSIIALVVLLLIIQFAMLMWVKRRSRSAILARYSPPEIIMQSHAANFFGQTSKGGSQIRGNGALVLTKDELWFKLALPQEEMTIPLRSITGTEIKKSHLKKSKMRELLHVEFNSPSGTDSAAWLVKNPQEWQREIEKLRKS